MSEVDEQYIDGVLEEFDPEPHDALKVWADRMPASDWSFVVEHMRRKLHDTAVMSICAPASRSYASGR